MRNSIGSLCDRGELREHRAIERIKLLVFLKHSFGEGRMGLSAGQARDFTGSYRRERGGERQI